MARGSASAGGAVPFPNGGLHAAPIGSLGIASTLASGEVEPCRGATRQRLRHGKHQSTALHKVPCRSSSRQTLLVVATSRRSTTQGRTSADEEEAVETRAEVHPSARPVGRSVSLAGLPACHRRMTRSDAIRSGQPTRLSRMPTAQAHLGRAQTDSTMPTMQRSRTAQRSHEDRMGRLASFRTRYESP